MSKRIDELERLAGLRRTDSLSPDEYHTAKAKLLSGKGSSPSTAFWLRYRTLLTLGGGAIGLALAAFIIKPLFATTAAPTEAGTEAGTEAPSEWTLSHTRDPMTDNIINSAVRTFTTPAALIEMTVTCSSDGVLTYRAASFDQDKQPLEMQFRTYNGSPIIPYEYRIGGNDAQQAFEQKPRFNNVVNLTAEVPPGLSPDVKSAIAANRNGNIALLRAPKVTLALHLTNSDASVVIDQTDAGLRSLIAPCLSNQLKALGQG
jgi:hypothetical protein